MQPLSETRWESRIKAINPLYHQIGEVYDSLEQIANDGNRDANIKHMAQCLAVKIKSFKFACPLTIWHDILTKINVVS